MSKNSVRARRLVVTAVAVVAASAGTMAAVAHAGSGGSGGPGGSARHDARWRAAGRAAPSAPRYSYEAAVRESVLVTSPLDSDADGRPDRVAVDVVRPREAADAGTRVPVIMEASPYYHDLSQGAGSHAKAYDAAGTITVAPKFIDNYFVPRGYAVALVDLAGTSRSTGCLDIGGPVETASAVAVLDWLNGRGRAAYWDGRPATADWSTGKVGMIGASWDGSVANAVAATRAPGLATVVAAAGISSWYDYVVGDGAQAPGEDPTAELYDVTSRPQACAQVRASIRAAASTNGDHTAFWAQRDYRAGAANVRASVFAVQGLADLNVMPAQATAWWKALGDAKVPRKLWLTQAGHEDPFNLRREVWVDTLHRWFDRWLLDVPNGIMSEPPVSVESAPGRWVDQPEWPARGSHAVQVTLGTGNGTTGTLNGPGTSSRAFTDTPALTEDGAVTGPTQLKAGRLVFLSGPLTADTHVSGTPAVTLRVRLNRPTSELTVRLVDYGAADRLYLGTSEHGLHKTATESCWGGSTAADRACFPEYTEIVATRDLGVVSRGWLDAARHASPTRRSPLTPGRWYPITVPMQPADAVLAAGHVLGLVVTGTDEADEAPVTTGARVEVDLAGSRLDLPVAGPAGLPGDVTTPPAVAGHDAPAVPGHLRNG
jgi:X-Pro dipeptidyl-peptidase